MEENNKKRNVLVIGIIFTLIILIGGVFAFYNYRKTVEAFTLTSSGITAKFTEGTNEIDFGNAYPISNEFAISNLDKLDYVDFTITGNAENLEEAVKYEIYLIEKDSNTLGSEYVKLYLTDENNNVVSGPVKYSNLESTTYPSDNSNGKVIYQEKQKGEFTKQYRLYMWLDSEYSQNDVSETFSFYVNLYAYNDTSNNIYTVTFDSGNLLYGLEENKEETEAYRIKYSINNGLITVKSLINDGYGSTNGKVYLEQGKSYIFSCNTNGYWQRSESTDSVEAYFLLDNSTSHGNYIWMGSPNNYEFIAPKTGVYWLRLDVNQEGKEYTFSNISVVEKETKQVVYGETYGSLPTPTPRAGYTFMGWNGKNLFNIENSIEGSDVIYTTGEIYDNDFWVRSDYIDCNQNTSYIFTYDSDSSYFQGRIVFYDNNKNYITGIYDNNSLKKVTLLSPSNAKYIMVSYSIGVNNLPVNRYSIQLEEGDNATEYEPYYIKSDTKVVQNQDHILKAIWKENT